jgi:iron complex outermembrane receptor protein
MTSEHRAPRIRIAALALASASLLPSVALAQAASQSAAGQGQIAAVDEVVVTAQRRSERLTDVPISVTSATAEELAAANVGSTGALGKIAPGLTMDRAGPFLQPTIRGIGSSVTGPGIGTSVAIYLDGFYQPSTTSNDFDLADVSTIQVLKGPQGTLFGRNSTGGAILVTTMDPTFKPTFLGRVSYGRYGDARGSALVSGGLNDKVAVYASVYFRQTEGYSTDIATGSHDQEASNAIYRLKALITPTDNTRVTLAYTHGDISDPWGVAQVAYHGVSAAAAVPGVVIPDDPYHTASTQRPKTKIDYDSYYLTGEVDFKTFTAKSYTGWREESDYVQLDSDKSSFPFQYIDFRPVDKTFTQEFDFNSRGDGRLQWVAGLYYYHDKAGYLDLGVTQGGPRFTFLNARLKSRAYAAFADVTYQVTDQLFLTVGARYNNEKVTETFNSILTGYTDESYSKTFDNVSPRAVVRYEIAPNTNIYASYNRGYKAGTFNPTGLSSIPVRPENVNAYEIGFKTQRANTRFEIAGFYYDYKDLQFVSYVGATARLTNAAKAKIYGVDASLVQRLGDHFRVSLTGIYTHAEYDEFPGAPHYTYLGGGVITNFPDDASGLRMVRTPRFDGRVSVNYNTTLAGGTLRANASLKYQSEVHFDPFAETVQSGYGLVDARVSWTEPSDRVTFSIYGQNLTNEHYYSVVTQQSESWPANYGWPRTYGAEISWRF